MHLNIQLHKLPREIKLLILGFITLLSIGFYGGINFVHNTTNSNPKGIESHYLGNENDEDAVVMKFKKSKTEILTIVHNHILSMAMLFFLLALILSTTAISKSVKYFLMFEPFISIILTFGGIYVLWSGVLWFKYVVAFSGVLMTLSFTLSVIIIFAQILIPKIFFKS
ncbi:hypothetical protein [Lutibacter sp.]